MITPTEDLIREIEGSLDCGLRVFVHGKTGDWVELPEEQYLDHGDEAELWADGIQKVESEPDDFLQIPKWSSHEAFSVMEEFTLNLPEMDPLRQRLLDALNHRHPFRGFNEIIHRAGPCREQWFAFRTDWQRNYVRNWFTQMQETPMQDEDE